MTDKIEQIKAQLLSAKVESLEAWDKGLKRTRVLKGGKFGIHHIVPIQKSIEVLKSERNLFSTEFHGDLEIGIQRNKDADFRCIYYAHNDMDVISFCLSRMQQTSICLIKNGQYQAISCDLNEDEALELINSLLKGGCFEGVGVLASLF